ncbi:bacillithiol biosynthesis cysteine-adding enzyme BshC [Heyndrickxia acidicola]|uniref:Putative cysteine ligase BshC n=1 Tax=Heyndrickxia acidicola TaxID=209389 RepID=A0ABU6MBY1_9BACI|nr:bacillithiol biosynthesis cysteine-adding enzyme BshC [Heyndrickxia acidicola]MED1202174.1 bacillithiol biosynthesis cysteine-adding enzyme BshC [Heyndrickxia acidicola]
MELEKITIPATNRFASLYIEQMEPVKDFFHYDIKKTSVFKERYADLQERHFPRESLARCIEEYMKRYPSSEQIKASLDKLKQEDSVVVIGGQQAGLLTGPLYTIHKLISVLKLAEEQEKALQKPVVPVFWIAGEDHDFLEINHVFVEHNRLLKKFSYSEGPMEKKMVSDVIFDQNQMKKWLHKVFEPFGETRYTKQVLDFAEQAAAASKTIVDFFNFIILKLFKKYGLLVIDSADPSLRKIEKAYFEELIQKHDRITRAVLDQQEQIQAFEFPPAIELYENAVNLFYYTGKERLLLEYDSQHEAFRTKNGDYSFSKSEIIDSLNDRPEAFSNNVVTRPLMQEWLFPTLAFIAGPGEISYWGELKLAFETMGYKMPPIVPRMNISFVESSIERDIRQLGLSVQQVVLKGVQEEKIDFWNSIKDVSIEHILEDIKAHLETSYEKIEEKTTKGLSPLVKKNLSFHLGQIDFLQRKFDQSLQEKNDLSLERYDRIERSLRPQNGPQERTWNLFYYLNKYGLNFIEDLMELPYEFDGSHKLIHI